MTHAWCTDVSRDAAVRAAEDGRDGALPTLEEAIDGMFPRQEATVSGLRTDMVVLEPLFSVRNAMAAEAAKWCDDAGVELRPVNIVTALFSLGLVGVIPKQRDPVSASSAADHENKGDGMRTERVTLEIVQNAGNYVPLNQWPWSGIFIGLQSEGGSVRVVTDEEREVEVERLRVALADAIRRPMGVIPESADGLVTQKELDEAEIRRPRNIPRTVLVEQLTDERDAAIRERDSLAARVAELEAATGGNSRAKPRSSRHAERDFPPPDAFVDALHDPVGPTSGKRIRAKKLTLAASGGGVVRDMTGIILSDTADADEKHAAMSTLVEAVFPGWVLSQAASGGGEQEAVAWGVMSSADEPHRVGLQWDQDFAERLARQKQSEYSTPLTVVPLYRSPPPPRGWLTEEERNALETVRVHISNADGLDEATERECKWVFDVCYRLLARSTPPEVVLPRSDDYGRRGDYVQRVYAALAAAGVKVKEVWSE